MSYKTILLHLDKKSTATRRIRIAANLAIAENASLVGIAMTGISTQGGQKGYIDALGFQPAQLDDKNSALASHLKSFHDRAVRFVEEFNAEVKSMNVPNYEGRIVNGDPSQGISLLGRLADLIVIGRTNLKEKAPIVPPDFPEYVMMNSGRPVLIVPQEYDKDVVGKRVMICWNASRESIRAVADALPILKRADLVQIVMYNIDNEPDVNAELAGSDIALYLSRHGINVEVLPPQKSKRIGKALLELAKRESADLLVMGGYGHTKFREFLLGGVTRTVLAESGIPVLMSH